MPVRELHHFLYAHPSPLPLLIFLPSLIHLILWRWAGSLLLWMVRDPSEDGSSQEMDILGESNDDMSKGNGLENSMMLVQYQEEARRDSLIRKGSHVMAASLKKGRKLNLVGLIPEL